MRTNWREDRRYPSKDGEHLITVYKRLDYDGKVKTKNTRRRLTLGEQRYFEERRDA
jgi:hypothetical protein